MLTRGQPSTYEGCRGRSCEERGLWEIRCFGISDVGENEAGSNASLFKDVYFSKSFERLGNQVACLSTKAIKCTKAKLLL
jgi:hypothetical protein